MNESERSPSFPVVGVFTNNGVERANRQVWPFQKILFPAAPVVGVFTDNPPCTIRMFEQDHVAFFTATIFGWKHLLKPDKYKRIILDSLQFPVENGRIRLYGLVIMPNHLHLLWNMQEPHLRENVQRDFLKFMAQQIKFDLQEHHPQVLERFQTQARDRQYQIWQRNALSVYCTSASMARQKLAYIHNNPVVEKWNLARLPEDYYFSSAAYYCKNGHAFGFLTHYLD